MSTQRNLSRGSNKGTAWLAKSATAVCAVFCALGCGEAFEHLSAPDDAAAVRDGRAADGARDSDAMRSDAAFDRSSEDVLDGTRHDASDGDATRTGDATNEPRATPDGSIDSPRGDGAAHDSTSVGSDSAGAHDSTTRDVNGADLNRENDASDGRGSDDSMDAPVADDGGGVDVSLDVATIDVAADAVEVDAAEDVLPDVGFVCGFAPPAPGGTCPAVCNEGCAGGICRIGCREDKQCKDAALECPAGFTCQVNCVGKHACESASVNCPDIYACSLLCGDDQSCKGLTFNCRSGTCNVDCLGNNACDAVVNCGSQTCTAVCQMPAPMGRPTMNCGESCDCRGCSP